METGSARIATVAGDRERFLGFLPRLAAAELLILSFPLYVDSPPAPVIRALEWIAAGRKGAAGQRQRLAVLVNSGFPEASHSETAVAICRRFATEAGFEWAGALALGGGGALDGRPLHSFGRLLRGVRQALDMGAAALAADLPIPHEATVLMGRPLMPVPLYLALGTLGFRRDARRAGMLKHLLDRPYTR